MHFYSRTAGCYPTRPKNVFLLKSTHGEILPKDVTRILEFFIIEFNSPREEADPVVLFYRHNDYFFHDNPLFSLEFLF